MNKITQINNQSKMNPLDLPLDAVIQQSRPVRSNVAPRGGRGGRGGIASIRGNRGGFRGGLMNQNRDRVDRIRTGNDIQKNRPEFNRPRFVQQDKADRAAPRRNEDNVSPLKRHLLFRCIRKKSHSGCVPATTDLM